MSLKIWRSGCASTLIFSPGKFLPSQIFPREREREDAKRGPSTTHLPPREYRNERVNQETLDFLNSRLRSVRLKVENRRISPSATAAQIYSL